MSFDDFVVDMWAGFSSQHNPIEMGFVMGIVVSIFQKTASQLIKLGLFEEASDLEFLAILLKYRVKMMAGEIDQNPLIA